MRFRQLGAHGPILSEVGLGTWAIGGPWRWGWGPQSDRDSIKAIKTSIDNGINWIDTAPIYGFGHAEELVGKAVRDYRREELFIATKCGLVRDNNGKVRRVLRPESISQEVDESLKRLGIDYIDLYQHHWPDPNTSIVDSWGEMVRLKEAGKVRYIGVCNYDVPLMKKCQQVHPLQSLQPPLSMIDREILPDILPYCQNHDIAVLAYSPLQNGLLTGKFNFEKLAQDDWRRRDPEFNEPKLSQNLNFVADLAKLAQRKKASLVHIALSWVLNKSENILAIVGARNTPQARENAGTSSTILSQQDMHEIEALLKKHLPFN